MEDSEWKRMEDSEWKTANGRQRVEDRVSLIGVKHATKDTESLSQ